VKRFRVFIFPSARFYGRAEDYALNDIALNELTKPEDLAL
jgi:hypothetical protein